MGDDALIPKPEIFRLGGEELSLAPLPIKRLVEIVRYVEDNFKELQTIDLTKAMEGGVAAMMEGTVYVKMNALVRLLFPDKAEKLTDEWCSDHMTNAHYRAIFITMLRQNQLYELFQMAKGLVIQKVGESLRQAGMVKPEVSP